jgi:transcriptional regulator of acetoin/glycerol metabolism
VALGNNGVLGLTDLPDEVRERIGARETDHSYRAELVRFERDYFRTLLIAHRGEVSAAARDAHLSRLGLYRAMRRCGLEVGTFRH